VPVIRANTKSIAIKTPRLVSAILHRMKREVGMVATVAMLLASVHVCGEVLGTQAKPLAVGLRRSSYGRLESSNADDICWTDRAKSFASSFPGSQPAIIEIVSTYLDDDFTAHRVPFGACAAEAGAGRPK